MIEFTEHFKERISETHRGFSPDEVESAVYKGSRTRLNLDKFIARCGHCEVVVYDRRKCRYRLITAQFATKR